MLYTTQHYLDGDEALIGVMAKDILQFGEHPLFFGAIHYNGAAAWEAHLGALTMLIGGHSDYSFKFTAIIVSFVLFLFIYLWVKENYGVKAGLIALFLLVFSATFIRWNVRVLGHLTLTTFTAILLWSFYRHLFRERPSRYFHLLVGLLCGLGVWCMESSLVVIGVFLLFWFHRDKRLPFTGKFWAWAGMFAVGLSPILYENFTHNFKNFKHLLGSAPAGSAGRSVGERLWSAVSHDFPSLFHADIVNSYPDTLRWWGWISFLIFLTASVYFLWRFRAAAGNWISGWFKGGKAVKVDYAGEKLLFIFIYTILFSSVFIFSKFSLQCARYLLVIMPGVFLITALFLERMMSSSRILLKALAVLVMVIWAYGGVSETLRVSGDNIVVLGSTKIPGEDITDMVEELRIRKIEGVFTHKFIKTLVIFYSKGDIIASRFLYKNRRQMDIPLPTRSLLPRYEKMVRMAGNLAVVFSREPRLIAYFEDFLSENRISYQRYENPSFTIYHDFTPRIEITDYARYLFSRGLTKRDLDKTL